MKNPLVIETTHIELDIVTIPLTQEEVDVLVYILEHIGGSPKTTLRRITDDIYQRLARFSNEKIRLKMKSEGSIYFLNNEVI